VVCRSWAWDTVSFADLVDSFVHSRRLGVGIRGGEGGARAQETRTQAAKKCYVTPARRGVAEGWSPAGPGREGHGSALRGRGGIGGSPIMPFLTLCELSPLSGEEDACSGEEAEEDTSVLPLHRAADSLSDESI
jgi:hypothetical protein